MTKELTIMITFFMIIFATALTRGGLLESVHAFGESPVGPVLLGFAFCVALYFFYLTRKANIPLYTFDIDTSSLYSISIFVAYWSLMFLLIICLFGVVTPIIVGFFTENPMTISVEFYNKWCFPFTLAFVAALMGCNIALKVKRYVMILIAVLSIGVVFALLGLPTRNPLANFGLPLLITAGSLIAYNFARLLQKKNSSSRLWGKTLVHLAVIVILIGVFVSSTAETESDNILAKPNSVIEVLETRIELNDFTIYTGVGSVYYAQHSFVGPEYSALKMDIAIEEGGNVHYEPLWLYYYPIHGIVSEPLIISTPTRDIYISMHQTSSSYNSLFRALMGEEVQPEDFVIVVKRVPLIWLVWTGIILMGIGMAVVLFDELLRPGYKIKK
jgi:cytochrome c biogenesis factor